MLLFLFPTNNIKNQKLGMSNEKLKDSLGGVKIANFSFLILN